MGTKRSTIIQKLKRFLLRWLPILIGSVDAASSHAAADPESRLVDNAALPRPSDVQSLTTLLEILKKQWDTHGRLQGAQLSM